MAIPVHMMENFQKFLEVPKDRIALMEVMDNKTKKIEHLIVIHTTDPNDSEGKTEGFVPIARFFSYSDSDNPYNLYTPPLP